jgi:hypothetical protein
VSAQRPFIPRSNLFYRTAVSMGTVGRYIGTIGMCLLIITIWLYGLYKPLSFMLNKRCNAICAQQAAADRVAHTYQQTLDVEASIHALRAHTPQQLGASHEQQMAYWVRALFDLLKATTITLVSYTADRSVLLDMQGTHALRLVLSGSLPTLATFCTDIRQKKMPIRCTHITCTKVNATHYLATIDMHIVTHAPKKGPLNLEQAEGLGG